MRRRHSAKIIATLGPASSSPERIRALFDAGVDVFRLNFSHGTHREHDAAFAAIRQVEAGAGRPIGILADLSEMHGAELKARWDEMRFLQKHTDHIARVAVATLTEDGHVGKGYLLTGPQALTAREQVEIIAGAIGRSIDFEDVTPHEFAEAAIQRGTPPEQARLMERLNEVFRARRSINITDDVENITGTAPATFRDWCERHAGAFR